MSYVLIIGAKSDIAKSLARKYSDCGYDIYLAARNCSELDEFAKDLSLRSQKAAKCVELDILDFDAHQGFYDALPEKPLGVISAVGYLGDQDKSQSDFAEAKKTIDTNYTGVVSLLNIVADDFEQRKSGFIIGISSVAGDRGRKANYLYGSAKAALSAYLSGLRNRLCKQNVHVMTVKPGFVDTKMTEDMDLPEKLTAQPDDVAAAIYKGQQKNA
ncbi:MAG: SDR family oxidoreductase, partial [Algicola sp.]|nr:SDR family oxidoreductase [Algicola sp.]